MNEKKIWIYWHQGFENTSDLIKKCVFSWQTHNPDYEIHLLDQTNIQNFIDIDDVKECYRNKPLELAALADVIRLRLLSNYGGIWVDATCFCLRPLNEWLPAEMTKNSGFFCPSYRPGSSERIMDNWFLASKKSAPLITLLEKTSSQYLLEKELTLFEKTSIGRRINRWTHKKTSRTILWFNPLVKNFLKIRPYFFSQYIFYKLTKENIFFALAFDEMLKIDVQDCNFKHFEPFEQVTHGFIEKIQEKRLPFFKLKKIWNKIPRGSKIYELLHSNDL